MLTNLIPMNFNMIKRLILAAPLLWILNAQAIDLGGMLSEVFEREVKRQVDTGVSGGVSGVFKSISEVLVGTTNPNAKVQGATPDQVVFYSTSTCGYCAQARKYMQSQGISYFEKDIGKDPAARAELKTVDDRGGVPVLLMGKYKLVGFEEARFNQTYAKFQADLKSTATAGPSAASGVSNTAGFNQGDVLTAKIAKVKIQASADATAKTLGYLSKNEEVIFLGENRDAWLKVRSADHEGWIEKSLLVKP